MASRPLSMFATPGRTRHRPRHAAPVLAARLILAALALIGAIAITLLILGLLNAHAVTNHFRIH
jgi:hypothetical protein